MIYRLLYLLRLLKQISQKQEKTIQIKTLFNEKEFFWIHINIEFRKTNPLNENYLPLKACAYCMYRII
jgi:hypothetical protein